MDVAVQIPAYMEADLDETLDAVSQQRHPRFVDELSFEAWVTPDGDRSTDPTWQTAQQHPKFSAHEAPRYKLNARNAAHDSAVERGYDVIVSWDADATPRSADSLAELLAPIHERNIVATNGMTRYTGSFGRVADVIQLADLMAMRPIYGRFSAFTADAWRRAGPFDESVDQTDMLSIRTEEEFNFRRRLANVGGVKNVWGAWVDHPERRFECTYTKAAPWKEPSEWCAERGSISEFKPANGRNFR